MNNKHEWQTLFDRTAIEIKEYARFLPAESDITRFELDWKFRLPQSYKSFIEVFGPGTLADEFLIRAPGCSDSKYDLEHLNSDYRKGFALTLKRHPQLIPRPEFLTSIIWFCTTFDATSFGWSSSEVSNQQTMEYAIYALNRGDFVPRLIMSSFTEFVVDLCLGDQYVPLYRSEPDPETNRYVFSPGRVRGLRIRKT